MKRFLLSLAILVACGTPPVQASTPFDETRPLHPDARVELGNLKGLIEVDTWERDEIRIAGQRGDGTKALSIEGDAGHLRVKIEYPESRGWFGSFNAAGEASELRVTVPVGVSLGVDSVSARIEVRGVAGAALRVNSVSGDASIRTGAKALELHLVSGDASIEADSAEVDIEVVSGDVELRGQISDRIELESVSGRLTLESGSPARQVKVGVVSGDVSLRTGLQANARLQAESLSGDLEVILPAATSARVTASSFSGSLRSDQGTVETEEYGPGSSLETTLGAGEGRIELESFSGDVRLRLE
jgi:hypothetical protein